MKAKTRECLRRLVIVAPVLLLLLSFKARQYWPKNKVYILRQYIDIKK